MIVDVEKIQDTLCMSLLLLTETHGSLSFPIFSTVSIYI